MPIRPTTKFSMPGRRVDSFEVVAILDFFSLSDLPLGLAFLFQQVKAKRAVD